MANHAKSNPILEQKQIRINETMITRVEKKVLLWLAARVPSWIFPDVLTSIGFLGSLVIFAGYALSSYHKNYLWLASLGFVIQWYGDSMDGTLARFRHIERPRYGFYVDHMIDVVSEVLIFVGLGISPFLRMDIAVLGLISYLLASVYVYITTYVSGVFRISYSGFSPTEFRLIAVATNTLIFFAGNPAIPLPDGGLLSKLNPLTLFDVVIIGVVLIILSLVAYNATATGIKLAREDGSLL
jgi:archaetidylinositol phosphate synthase